MEKIVLIKAFVLQLLLAGSYGSISILYPKELRQSIGNDGNIKASLGNFGHIVYGSSVVIISECNVKFDNILIWEASLPSI